MKCVRCGTELKEGDKFCLGCGFEVGQKYTPAETNATLEGIMEMKVEKEEEPDNAEEMEIDSNENSFETIDGNKVEIKSNIKESTEEVKKKKQKSYFILIFLGIIILLSIITFLIIKFLFNNTSSKPDVVIDKKGEIINSPTTPYSFDSRFIFKLKNTWQKKENDNYLKEIKDIITFEKNSSEFKLIKYSFDENNITAYLNYVGIENCDSIEINNITYNYIKTNGSSEYFIVSNDAIYVFSFTETSENDINEILNTVTYYK